MAAKEAFESILNQVQSSCLNFKIEMSPFSAVIYLKKSFIKNQNGDTVLPPAEIATERNVAVKHLEQEKNILEMKIVKATQESKACHEALDNMKKEIDQKEKMLENLVKSKNNTEEEMKYVNTELYETKFELTRQLEIDDELREKVDNLEDENLKLKDVLYGCPECGLYSCECDHLENEENYTTQSYPSSPPASPTSAASALLDRPCPSSPSPWTPPPTPPCVGCGGINFGPTPGSLCFVCIPPLDIKPPPDSSPSHTPPGTPPPTQHRLGTTSKKKIQQ